MLHVVCAVLLHIDVIVTTGSSSLDSCINHCCYWIRLDQTHAQNKNNNNSNSNNHNGSIETIIKIKNNTILVVNWKKKTKTNIWFHATCIITTSFIVVISSSAHFRRHFTKTSRGSWFVIGFIRGVTC